jgi:hypothetical protein
MGAWGGTIVVEPFAIPGVGRGCHPTGSSSASTRRTPKPDAEPTVREGLRLR